MRLNYAQSSSLEHRQKLAHLGSYSQDLVTGELVWSDAVYRILGYEPKEIELSFDLFSEHVHPQDRDRFLEANQAFWNGDSAYDLLFRLVCRDETIRTVRSIAHLVRAENGTPRQMFGAIQDITDYGEMLQALEASQVRSSLLTDNLLSILDAIPEFLCVLDKDDSIKFTNRAFRKLFGEPIRDRCPHYADARKFSGQNFPAKGAIRASESLGWELTTSNGNIFLVHSVPYTDPFGQTCVIELGVNITGRKETEHRKTVLEEQLQQSQKLEAIGQLAGGVAHCFNNILTSIIGNAELLGMSLEKELPLDHSHRLYLDQILQSGERAAVITKQLLAVGMKQQVSPKIVDPLQVIQNIETLLRPVIRENIAISIPRTSQSLKVYIDPNHLEQSVLNLVLNAQDAMPDGGTLAISVQEISPNSFAIPEPSTLAKADSYISIGVSDTGVGISKENMDHVFEPFFTTKEIGQGSGLGLAMVHGIVSQAQGLVTLDSTPDQGSTFTLILPRVM
jgi:signal transduction histidine kinase